MYIISPLLHMANNNAEQYKQSIYIKSYSYDKTQYKKLLRIYFIHIKISTIKVAEIKCIYIKYW